MGIWTQIMSKLLKEDRDYPAEDAMIDELMNRYYDRLWEKDQERQSIEDGLDDEDVECCDPGQLYCCFSKDAQQQLASDPESYIAMLDRSIALAESCSSYDVIGEWTEFNGQFS